MGQLAQSPSSNRVVTGIAGFDDVTSGGLPRGRVTVVTGGPGCGKTIFALHTLVTGARELGEKGIFVAFEESVDNVLADAGGFDWDLASLRSNGIAFVDAQLADSIVQGGEFDLIGLLAGLGELARTSGARRIVFDGVDVLLGHLADPASVRREIFRIRNWIQQSGLTGLITAKEDAQGREPAGYEFLHYMADAVVALAHRVVDGIALRFARVAKYRGAAHLANEIPFTITRQGVTLATFGGIELVHSSSRERLSSGVERLDTMLGGGYFRGSSVLVSGSPGTAKTSLAVSFARAMCLRDEPTLFVSFDEAPEHVMANVRSIGVELASYVASGILRMSSFRTAATNPEAHVARVRDLIASHRTRHLIIDPLSALLRVASVSIAERAAIDLLDFAKQRGITVLSTSLLASASPLSEETPLAVSTIADTWMHLSYLSQGGERNRALTIVKSRGTDHSNQVRELSLSAAGVTLRDAYTVGGEVLMGTLRWQRENEVRHALAADCRAAELREQSAEVALAETKLRLGVLAREQALRESELQQARGERQAEKERLDADHASLLVRRGADLGLGSAE